MVGLANNLILLFVFKKLKLTSTIYYQFNNMMIIFNIIPIYPLDGYRLINLFLSKIYDDEYCYHLLAIISMFFLVILFLLLLIFRSLSFGIIILFLIVKQVEYYRNYKLKIKQNKILLTNYFKNN